MQFGGSAGANLWLMNKFKTSEDAFLNAGDLSLFIAQLALMLRCGLPLAKALDILGDSGDPNFETVSEKLVFEIMAGFTLSGAMARQPRSFSPYCCATVQAGEVSGQLVACLERLATSLEKRLAMMRRIKGALVYPCVLAVACFGMILVVLYLVFPMVIKVTAQTGVEPPALTRLLISVSSPNVLFTAMGVGFLLVNAVVLILRDEERSKSLRVAFEISTPPGAMLARTQVAEALQQLALMLDTGIDLGKALSVAALVTGRSVLVSSALTSIRASIIDGNEFSTAMDAHPVFPRFVASMVTVAEEGGSLSKSLTQAAEMIEEDLDHRIDILSSLVEPMLMGVAGFCVGTVLLGAFLPLYNLIAL